MSNTSKQYQEVITSAKVIFVKKNHDYGTSWRVLRPISIVDQIYIKAKRIRTIQEGKKQLVADDIASEWMGIINYAIIGLIQLDLGNADIDDLDAETCFSLYDKQVNEALTLMGMKNHDYGEAWRDMSEESMCDLILTKLHRMKQIIRNQGKTLISEGLDANFLDILNYAVFAMILQSEASTV